MFCTRGCWVAECEFSSLCCSTRCTATVSYRIHGPFELSDCVSAVNTDDLVCNSRNPDCLFIIFLKKNILIKFKKNYFIAIIQIAFQLQRQIQSEGILVRKKPSFFSLFTPKKKNRCLFLNAVLTFAGDGARVHCGKRCFALGQSRTSLTTSPTSSPGVRERDSRALTRVAVRPSVRPASESNAERNTATARVQSVTTFQGNERKEKRKWRRWELRE